MPKLPEFNNLIKNMKNNWFLPAFQILSEEIRNKFILTETGQKLKQIQEGVDKQKSRSWLKFYWNYEKITIEATAAVHEILVSNQEKEEVKQITIQIIRQVLLLTYEDYQFLDESDQLNLASKPFSESLKEIPLLNKKIKDNTKKQSMLIEKKETILKTWLQQFNDDLSSEDYRRTIQRKKNLLLIEEMKERAQILENELPAFFEGEASQFLQKKYDEAFEELADNIQKRALFSKMEVDFLTVLIFKYLEKSFQSKIDYANLYQLNLKFSESLASEIINALDKNKTVSISRWLNGYKKSLFEQLLNGLTSINGKPYVLPALSLRDVAAGALSLVFRRLPSVLFSSKSKPKDSSMKQSIQNFLVEMSDAHGFIQAIGFSTQNESSFLAIFDIYNYGRLAKKIAEAKSIVSSLLKPLLPIYKEYREISLFEKNALFKIIKTVMPMLILASFMVLISVLLAPLVLPELVFIFILIPTLYLGLVLTAKYVEIKDKLYQAARSLFYGDNIPEFQMNERLQEIFKNSAQWVINYYLKEIKQCESIELSFAKKAKKGLLDEESIQERDANNLKKYALCLEWYDIHSNYEHVSTDTARTLVKNRIKEATEQEFQELRHELIENNELTQLKVSIDNSMNLIESNFSSLELEFKMLQEDEEVVHDETGEAIELIAAEESDVPPVSEDTRVPERPEISISNQFTLFKPEKTLKHLDNMAYLTLLESSL